MIQRIQSVYLLVVIIASLLLFFFPVVSYYGDYHTFQLGLLGIEYLTPDAEKLFTAYFTLPLLFLVVLIAINAFTTIVSFKNRLRQLKLIKVNLLLNIILVITIFLVYSRLIQSVATVEESFNMGAFFPLISLIFLILANRAIKKDEKLVRSADRLR